MKQRDEILDLVRGLSALMVLVAHVRGFVLVDMNEVVSAGLLTKMFYFGTGLHHQAVMVFFVLSGYFVGGSVIETFGQRRFSAAHYALARLSRLWVALIPALLLTLACDATGRALQPDAYAGGFRDLYMSGPEPEGREGLSPLVFFGNLVFLQTVELPVFGSNGPLWSLANEFWYYILFPLMALAVAPLKASKRRGIPRALGAAALFVILCWWLPWGLVSKGLIWLLGVAVWWLASKMPVTSMTGRMLWRSLGALVFAGTLAASKTSSVFGSDFAVGLAFAAWMPSLLGAWAWPGWWVKLGNGLSAISYTLYVVHFPILFLVAATQLGGLQFQPTGPGLLWFFGLSLLSLAVAVIMWWLFERRTDGVRRWLARVFRLPSLKTAHTLPSPP